MAKTIKRYNNCTPVGESYTGAAYVGVTNGTEGILKVTIGNPDRPLEPMKEYIDNVKPGGTCKLPAGLTDRKGVAITSAEVVVIVEGSTVPVTVIV
jgi:hypothetical protein